MKALIQIYIIICICVNVAEAQITFEETYGGPNEEKAVSVQQTPDDGYIIGGTNLVKVDEFGTEEWTQSNFSNFTNITSDGGYILMYSNGNTIKFTKLAQDGSQSWVTYFSDGIWANHGEYIEEVEDGYIVTGRFQDVTGSGLLLLKLDFQGNKVWRRSYSDPTSAGFSHGFSAQQTTDKGYIVAGFAHINYYDSTRHKDIMIVKTDTFGVEEWRKFFGGSADELGTFVRQDNDKNYFISGTTNSYGVGTESNMYLIKLDSLGDSLWTKTYGGNLTETATALWPTNDGGCIIVGKSNSFSAGDFDGYIVKTDANGDTLWTKIYGGLGEETINSVQQTADNGYIMAGFTDSEALGDFDMWLLKTDSLGNLSTTSTIAQHSTLMVNYAIYPNPNNGLFSIESDLEISTVEVFNTLGVMVYSATINTTKTAINLTNQSKGIYFYRLRMSDNTILKTGKIVFE